ncbi:MAG: hypothetical protein JSS72_13780 [Armatimonadetes bacterium]|nr:hypothetical protein [Armatimonadota bacterium]
MQIFLVITISVSGIVIVKSALVPEAGVFTQKPALHSLRARVTRVSVPEKDFRGRRIPTGARRKIVFAGTCTACSAVPKIALTDLSRVARDLTVISGGERSSFDEKILRRMKHLYFVFDPMYQIVDQEPFEGLPVLADLDDQGRVQRLSLVKGGVK